MSKVESECGFCGDKFTHYSKISRKFCSRECYHKNRRKRVNIECEVCGEEFEDHPSQNRTTCSKECQYKYFETEYKNKNILTCNYCGSNFEVIASSDQKYCSVQCYNQSKECNYTEHECQECGESFKARESANRIYCSNECNYENQRNKVRRECRYCKEEYITTPSDNPYYCSLECMGKDRRGSNHSNWKGGASLSYGYNWWKRRKQALKRDNHECVICCVSKEEGRYLDVHHIKPLRTFDDLEEANKLDNLVTLCRSHHRKVESWGLAPANVLD